MKKLTAIASAAFSVTALTFSGCGLTEGPPFEPRRLEQIQREQAQLVPTRPLRPLPTIPESIMPAEGAPTALPARIVPEPVAPTVYLKLQEVIHRAVLNNLDAQVAGYQAAIDEARIVEAQAQFDPTFFSQVLSQRQHQLSGVFFNPENVRATDSQQLQAGIRQLLPNGGQVELRAQSVRTDTEGLPGPRALEEPTEFNPYYQNELALQITQPLLKNFGGDVNRARITIARNDQKISSLEWRARLEEVLLNLEQAYWRLYQATLDVKIQEALLERSLDTLDILIKRLKQDTSRVHVSQAYATVRAREAALVRARAQIGDLSDQIKRLMNDPDYPVTSPVVILPSDLPIQQDVQFNFADQIEIALQNRFDLIQQKLRIDSASTIVRAAKNNVLPELNLIGSVGLQGFGVGFRSAFDEQVDRDQVNYSLGLSFEVPFGNRGPRAIYQRTLLQRQQAIEQYRVITEQTALEVKIALRAVETAWEEIVATRHARFAAEDALAAIEQRERAGEQLTPTFLQLKLDRQEALANTQRAEAEATAAYNIAIASLERAKGTLMEYNNVALKEEGHPAFVNYKGAKRADQSAK